MRFRYIPGTIDMLLEAYLCVQNRELKFGDVILGFNIQEEYPGRRPAPQVQEAGIPEKR